MQVDTALVAQESSRRAEAELGPDQHQLSHSMTLSLLKQDRPQARTVRSYCPSPRTISTPMPILAVIL